MWKTWTGGPQASPVNSPQSGSFAGPGGGGAAGWHPTIMYLGLLLLLEFAVVWFVTARR